MEHVKEPLSFYVEPIENGYVVNHNINGVFKKEFKATVEEVYALFVNHFHAFFQRPTNPNTF